MRTSVSYVLTAGADVENLRTIDDDGIAAIDLTGNDSGNVVRGNNGTNVINGGDGDDELTGRGGADAFLFDTALNATNNVDVIADFSVADDTIQLENAVFAGLDGGTLGANQFVIGAAAQDADDRIVYDNNTGALSFDSDGAGGAAAVQFAEIERLGWRSPISTSWWCDAAIMTTIHAHDRDGRFAISFAPFANSPHLQITASTSVPQGTALAANLQLCRVRQKVGADFGREVPMAIKGTSGDDTFRGTPFAEEIFGLGGKDFISGSPGADTIDGGRAMTSWTIPNSSSPAFCQREHSGRRRGC